MTIFKNHTREERLVSARKQGFALLVSVLVSSLVLAIGLSIITITLKQLQFSNIGRESEIAFYAADAGMECALYWDYSTNGGHFDFGTGNSTISCMGGNISINPSAIVGSTQTVNFQATWGTSPTVCAVVTVKKYYNATAPITIESGDVCPLGVTCTRTVSKGYNVNCSALLTPNLRTVERSIKAVF